MDKQRFYSFLLELYNEQTEILQNIFNTYECIYILHDKDYKDDGELATPHYHVIVKLQNAKTISALAKEFGMMPERIEPIKKGLNTVLKYLIHNGYENKYQYSIEDVKYNSINLYNRLKKLITDNISESEKVNELIDFICDNDSYLTFTQFAKYCSSIDKWDVLRRSQYIFIKLIEEHNQEIAEK